MRPIHLPLVNPRFWLALSLASVVGAVLGDFMSHNLGLGHWRGVPVLSIAFGAVVWAERRSTAPTELFYWAAILIVRAAATNLGDLATHDLGMDDLAVAAVVAIALAGIALTTRTVRADGQPTGNGTYWGTMLVAGVLGTALGDGLADAVGLGTSLAGTSAVWAVAMAVVAGRPALASLPFWATVALIRTTGTNAGDFVAGRHGLGVGLPLSLALSLVALVGLLTLWRPGRRTVAGDAPDASRVLAPVKTS